ncbi:uncharacterized protein EAF01_004040 [Botrytis porri]|uniref:uncharacterized protein n=1 Tax=Botrytis porri TaxID=87229 RepID=UPI00190211DA|nr:uncharacterized protein EAF01_004040 [Botrytis porri]KAF7908285.1 hypothetical protein EAF01_004040 [Botrytis porri]
MALPTTSTPNTTLPLLSPLTSDTKVICEYSSLILGDTKPPTLHSSLAATSHIEHGPIFLSLEEELSEAEKRIQKASVPEIVNKLEVCSSTSVATPDLAGLLYLCDGQGPEFSFGRREEKTKLGTQRLPDEFYSAILTMGGLQQAEKFWQTIAHSPSDTAGHDSSGCTE